MKIKRLQVIDYSDMVDVSAIMGNVLVAASMSFESEVARQFV